MAGVAARRKADALIASGRVTVNGAVPPPGGVLVEPGVDRVEVDGRGVEPSDLPKTYFMVNKPRGYLSAVSDRGPRPVVTALLGDRSSARLHPVGRLDLDSRGLILLTDDGELSFRLQHPRHHVDKEYEVTVAGSVEEPVLARLRAGVELPEGRTAAAEADVISQNNETTVVRVVLRQGWKRQIRRSFRVTGHEVLDLRRVRVGPLRLGSWPRGGHRALSDVEVGRCGRPSVLTEGTLVVSIDGPSASGKSTLGRMLARHLGLPFVDSGLMYRAVTVLASESGVDPSDVEALARIAEGAEIEVNTSAAESGDWESSRRGPRPQRAGLRPGARPAPDPGEPGGRGPHRAGAAAARARGAGRRDGRPRHRHRRLSGRRPQALDRGLPGLPVWSAARARWGRGKGACSRVRSRTAMPPTQAARTRPCPAPPTHIPLTPMVGAPRNHSRRSCG